MDAFLKYAPLALSMLNLGGYLLLWIVRNTLVSRDSHEALTLRLAALEAICEHCVARAGFAELTQKAEALNGKIDTLNAKLEGLSQLLERTEGSLARLQEKLFR